MNQPTPPTPVHAKPTAPVETDAPVCRNCGTIMVRTGKCHTCPDCGDTAGCS